jgi:hypothetical protein
MYRAVWPVVQVQPRAPVYVNPALYAASSLISRCLTGRTHLASCPGPDELCVTCYTGACLLLFDRLSCTSDILLSSGWNVSKTSELLSEPILSHITCYIRPRLTLSDRSYTSSFMPWSRWTLLRAHWSLSPLVWSAFVHSRHISESSFNRIKSGDVNKQQQQNVSIIVGLDALPHYMLHQALSRAVRLVVHIHLHALVQINSVITCLLLFDQLLCIPNISHQLRSRCFKSIAFSTFVSFFLAFLNYH